jgi:phage shock protein E
MWNQLMKKNRVIVMVIVIALAGWMVFQAGGGAGTRVDPAGAVALLDSDSNVVVLDVRTPGEFTSSTGHLEGAILIPVQDLASRLDELEPYREKTILVYCRTQNRSTVATKLLTEKGFNAVCMTGGIVQWNAEQRPVVVETR